MQRSPHRNLISCLRLPAHECVCMCMYVALCVCVYAWAFTHIAARRQVETQMDIEKNDKDSENDKLEFREIGGTQR